MPDYVELSTPHDGVALVTVTDPERQNNLCWQAVGELADTLEQARVAGARVTVVASGVEGHGLEHADPLAHELCVRLLLRALFATHHDAHRIVGIRGIDGRQHPGQTILAHGGPR